MTNTITTAPILTAGKTAQDPADTLVGRYVRTTGLAELDAALATLWQADAIHGLALRVASTADMPRPEAARLVEELLAETSRLYELLAGVEAAYMTLERLVACSPLLAGGLSERGL